MEKELDVRSSYQRRGFERILCPTDLTADSDQALSYAVALARAYGAKLYVCHCVEGPDNDLHGQIKGLYHIKGLFEESLGPYVGLTRDDKLDWEGIVVNGKPSETIAREAAQRRIDLIVMRSRRRPYAAALLGSTAESICRMAPCPVMVTHPYERSWVNSNTGEIALKRLLVAYDFSDYAELSLSYALSLAQEYQSELHLLFVAPVRPESMWYPANESEFHKIVRRLQYVVPADVHLWCDIKYSVREGHPYREVLDYADENKIDLVCMGAHGAGFGKWALFGSNVDRVLRQAACPVFIARSLKPAINAVSEVRGINSTAQGDKL